MTFQPLTARNVRWAPVSGKGLEHLHLTATPDGMVAKSVVIGELGGVPYGISYEIRCDPLWRVRSFRIEATHGDVLALVSPGEGRWQTEAGAPRPDLDGCVDLDLAGTPFTNTLPIRRLGLTPDHGPVELRMLYVPFDTFEPIPDGQRYTVIEANRRYLFEAVDGSFTAELPVDEDGLVTNYPTLFKRL